MKLSELKKSDITPGTMIVWRVNPHSRGIDIVISVDPNEEYVGTLESSNDMGQIFDNEFELFDNGDVWMCCTHVILPDGRMYERHLDD